METSMRKEEGRDRGDQKKKHPDNEHGMDFPLVLFVALFDRVQEGAFHELQKAAGISLSICEKEATLRLLRSEAIAWLHQSTAAASTG